MQVAGDRQPVGEHRVSRGGGGELALVAPLFLQPLVREPHGEQTDEHRDDRCRDGDADGFGGVDGASARRAREHGHECEQAGQPSPESPRT